MARPSSPSAMAPSSPPQQVMSKKDKRRRNVLDKLNDMITVFGRDQNQHYRAQLQAFQVDMTLILRADPYENAPLQDSPQHIEEMIDSVIGHNLPVGRTAKDDFYALAGRRYNEYCQEINKAQEKRDSDLTMLKTRYDSSMAELDRVNGYKIQVAQREHLELSSTIRQRLISTVTKKRDRLLRDKEQLDIADSNSLLLHPNHYTMNIPNSPGGLHSNRKTRHSRHRLGEADEVSLDRGKKRKLGEDDHESPNPGLRPATQDGNGGLSPFQEQRAKTLRTQQEASAYSIESIFSEKELTHATNVAQSATHHFFLVQQKNGQQANGSNGETVTETNIANGGAEKQDGMAAGAEEAAPSPAAPEAAGMERQVSNYATRGATKANPLAFLSDAAVATAPNELMANPFLPVMIPITRTDKGAPTPPGAQPKDLWNDLSMMMCDDETELPPDYMARPGARPKILDNGEPQYMGIRDARTLWLQQACSEPVVSQPFRVPLTDLGPAMISGGVNRPAAIGFADPASIPNGIRDGGAVGPGLAALPGFAGALANGGISMSRTTSLGGSDMGANEGGVGMRRTRSRAV